MRYYVLFVVSWYLPVFMIFLKHTMKRKSDNAWYCSITVLSYFGEFQGEYHEKRDPGVLSSIMVLSCFGESHRKCHEKMREEMVLQNRWWYWTFFQSIWHLWHYGIELFWWISLKKKRKIRNKARQLWQLSTELLWWISLENHEKNEISALIIEIMVLNFFRQV